MIRWSADPSVERAIQVYVDDATGGYTLHWGDATSTSGRPNQVLTHTYTAPGVYSLHATASDSSGMEDQHTYVTVPDGLTPPVTVEVSAGNPYITELTVNDPDAAPVPRYRLTWGDNADPVDVVAPPGSVHEHTFPVGTHMVTARNLSTRRIMRTTVDIVEPEVDPDVAVTEDTSDPERMSVTLEVTNTSGTDRQLRVHWGDGTSDDIAATNGQTAAHTYTEADFYFVKVAYVDAPSQATTTTVTVPFEG